MPIYNQKSLDLHRSHKGKLQTALKVPLNTAEDLGTAYTPGVAAPCEAIAKDPSLVNDLTVTGNAVAVVTDGTAVLGLGNIGPRAAMPVMEGKAVLFKHLVDLDAWPICLDVHSPDGIVAAVTAIAPGFAGINLEDIAAPACFEVEHRLQDLGIPVMHDDQHGTAIVLLAGLVNACRITGKKFSELRVVISGAGAAGRGIMRMLRCVDQLEGTCDSVGEILVCDSRGVLHTGRGDLSPLKREMLETSNPDNRTGGLKDVLKGADVFIGVSKGNLLTAEDIRSMAKDPFVFALANPAPEIMPDEARKGGAAIIATGRGDFPNQVNNVLAFPGVFRGAINARAPRITDAMKAAAAAVIAYAVTDPQPDNLLPNALDRSVAYHVAAAVAEAAG